MEQAAIATHNYSPPLTPVKKRKRADGKGYRRNSELTGSLHFGALRPRSRHADQETAKLKWEVLPDSLQDRVLELFETVEWPVIKQFQEDRKKTEAQVAVSSITRTLGKRLPRMLFPPNTKDVHFEYEALIEANRDSEQNLTSTLHSIALLNDEIAKEEKSLAIARADLAELQRNSRAELGLRHDKSSKVRNSWQPLKSQGIALTHLDRVTSH
ncbi:hypothetical protein MMC06_000245 [Schaereria dolodes]|nr:hypothetical protein [Schaereria dolodes]